MSGDFWTRRLSAYLDGELAPDERQAIEGHLADCEECTATLAELREVVAHARALPDRSPVHDLWPGIAHDLRVREGGGRERRISGGGMHLRRFRVSPIAIAASIAVLIALAITGAPAAAWVMERLTSLVGIASPPETPVPVAAPTEPPPTAPVEPPPTAPAILHLTPPSDELILEFSSHQAQGSLEISLEDVSRAAIEIVGTRGSESLLATPAGFQIRNSERSTADYRVVLPASLHRVEIRIGEPQDVYVIRDLYLPLRWMFGLQEHEAR